MGRHGDGLLDHQAVIVLVKHLQHSVMRFTRTVAYDPRKRVLRLEIEHPGPGGIDGILENAGGTILASGQLRGIGTIGGDVSLMGTANSVAALGNMTVANGTQALGIVLIDTGNAGAVTLQPNIFATLGTVTVKNPNNGTIVVGGSVSSAGMILGAGSGGIVFDAAANVLSGGGTLDISALGGGVTANAAAAIGSAANPVTLQQAVDGEPQLQEMRKNDEAVARLMDMAMKLEGLYRHASTHAAGVVIGDRPLDELVPLYRDPNADMPVTQFNMKWVEPAGLVKFDFLGLKTLTVLRAATDLLRLRGIEVDLPSLPIDDERTYERLRKGETVVAKQGEYTVGYAQYRFVFTNNYTFTGDSPLKGFGIGGTVALGLRNRTFYYNTPGGGRSCPPGRGCHHQTVRGDPGIGPRRRAIPLCGGG